jgi:predicted DNA-binding protein (UPF0251 family)
VPRPPKWRRVEFLPVVTYFKPAGVPLRQLDEVVLTVEELEALRLKDIEGLEQEDCAEKMGISRPTFFRILNSAHSKVADALVKGKAIRIEGGKYHFSQFVKCLKCGHVWEEVQKENIQAFECPECHSTEWVPAGNHRGWCHGHRQRGPFDYLD